MGKNFINKLLPLALTAAMIVPSVPAMAAPSDIARALGGKRHHAMAEQGPDPRL